MTPRISALLPTADRRRFIPGAIAQFLAQGRDDAELIILDDGTDPVADLIPADPRIRYYREEARRVIGDKRNRLCELARGDILIHWDDDDWHAPDRIARQVAALDASGADIVGLATVDFLSDDGTQAWRYAWQGRGRWVYGASLAYRRAHWARHRFPHLRTGEDTRWVQDAPDAAVHAMADSDWLIARVHSGNTSRKQTGGSFWQPQAPAPLRDRIARWSGESPVPRAPLRNVYILSAHEALDCVVDTVRNLRWHDPVSPILLYDGSARGRFIDAALPWDSWGVEVVPDPKPIKWGYVHGFALDCIAHLQGRDFDVITNVDSDQMAMGRDYPAFLAANIEPGPVGVLSNDPSPQRRDSGWPPAKVMWQERPLWQPFLDRFVNGDDAFIHWSSWPATVIGAAAAREIARIARDPLFLETMAASRMWATEEVLFPTLAKLLGFPVALNPCEHRWTQWRQPYTLHDVDAAIADPRAFWMHTVPRRMADPLRRRINAHCDDYAGVPPGPWLAPTAEAAVPVRPSRRWQRAVRRSRGAALARAG